MAGTLIKRVMLKIVSDDGDTEEKLDKISEKADELGRKHPDLKVKIDTAAASAKLAALRRELKDVDKQGEESRLTFKGFASDLAEMATGLGAGSGAVGEMSMFQKVMLGLNVATGLGEPLIAGLTVAVGGLSAGLVSAGAGLGVFGVVAKEVWSGVSSNISAAYAAQQKIANGATGKNLIADNKALLASLKGLNAGQKSLVLGASNAELSWHQFVQRSAAGVASVLVPALALVPKSLALVKPFLAPVEGALRGIVSGLGKSMSSGGLKSFMDVMAKNSGPMLTMLAHAIENIVSGLGGILKTFMPVAHEMMHGLDDITGKFAKWGNTLGSHSGFKSLMSMFKSETPLAVGALKNLAGIIKTVVSQMTGMSTFSNSKMLLQLALPVLKLVNALLKAHPQLVWLVLYLKLAFDGGKKLKGAFEGISGALGGLKTAKGALSDIKSGFGDADAAASEATGSWGSFGGMIKKAAVNLGLMKAAQTEATAATEEGAAAQGEMDAAMDANPIGLIVLGIAAVVIAIVELTKHSKAFRDFWKAAWKDIKTAAVDAWHFIDNDMLKPLMKGIGKLVDWVKSHWKLLATIIATVLLGPIAGLIVFVATHWDKIRSLTSRLVRDVVHFFEQLPGKIRSALSHLASDLFNLGKNAVMGLIHGAESLIGDVTGIGSSIGHALENGFKSVLSIFSPSRVMFRHGQMVGLGLIGGMDSMRSPVAASAAHLAAAVAAAARPQVAGGGASLAAAGSQMQISLRVEGGSDQLANAIGQSLRGFVRHRGGGDAYSAQRAFGAVWK